MGVFAGSGPVLFRLKTVYSTSKLLSEQKTPILLITIVASGKGQKMKSITKFPIEKHVVKLLTSRTQIV